MLLKRDVPLLLRLEGEPRADDWIRRAAHRAGRGHLQGTSPSSVCVIDTRQTWSLSSRPSAYLVLDGTSSFAKLSKCNLIFCSSTCVHTNNSYQHNFFEHTSSCPTRTSFVQPIREFYLAKIFREEIVILALVSGSGLFSHVTWKLVCCGFC